MATAFKMFFVLMILLSNISCSETYNDSKIKMTTPPKPLILLMHGNFPTGCVDMIASGPDALYQAEEMNVQFLQKFRSLNIDFKNADIVISCFDSSDLHFIHNKRPYDHRQITARIWDNYRGFLATVEDYFQFVRLIWKKDQNRPVFIIGHSYGGWLAMVAAAHIPQMKINGLYTIDPISYRHCSYSSPFNCQESPQDFLQTTYEIAAKNSSHWLNFYQPNGIIHSSRVYYADQNLIYNDSEHRQIDGDERVWNKIKFDAQSTF